MTPLRLCLAAPVFLSESHQLSVGQLRFDFGAPIRFPHSLLLAHIGTETQTAADKCRDGDRDGDRGKRRGEKERPKEREREKKKVKESDTERERERETERDTKTETETDTDKERKGKERMKKTKTKRQREGERTHPHTHPIYAAFLDLTVEFSVSPSLFFHLGGAYIAQSLALWCASSH